MFCRSLTVSVSQQKLKSKFTVNRSSSLTGCLSRVPLALPFTSKRLEVRLSVVSGEIEDLQNFGGGGTRCIMGSIRFRQTSNPQASKATCKRAQQLPTMLGVVSQQCCVRLHGAKSLTGFKLCATTRNNIQQHATGCANGRNM